jgi:hypothetical protein
MKKNEMGGACSTYGGMRNAHKIVVGKPEMKRPLGRNGYRSYDNIGSYKILRGYELDSSGSG